MTTTIGSTTIDPVDIFTSKLPPASSYTTRRLFRVVSYDGTYRLAESPQGECDFAAVRGAGVTSITVEVIRGPAYTTGIFTHEVTCGCRPARLTIEPPRPGALGRELGCGCD